MDEKERKRLQKEEAKRQREAEKLARKEQRLKEKTARELRRTLATYARDEKFAARFAQAIPLFWNEHYTLDTADEMDMNEALRFFDWYIFDYQPEGEPRLLDLFAEDMQTDITVFQQEIIDDWHDAPPTSAYIYEGFDGFSQEFKLRDFFTQEEFIAFSGAGTGRAMPGDLIITRLVPVGERTEFSTVAAYIPKDEINDLSEKVAAAQAEHSEQDKETFQRQQRPLLIVHHMLAQAEANDRFPVARLNPRRIDKTVQRGAKKVAKKVIKRRKK